MVKAVYIHIPFCSSICSYCDFCKRYYDKKFVIKYLESLKKEINEKYRGEQIETLYIGGGTPSSLDIDDLNKLFNILKIFNLDNLKEFTFECNINDIEEEKLKVLFNNGVNRLSIGIETINSKLLKVLNRNHNKTEVTNKIKLLKKIGFKNINVDLMYALPSETMDDLKNDVDFLLNLDINHISTYSLIINDNTNLGINNTKDISDELDYQMYSLIEKTLTKHKFQHYELSNYCKIGFESKHNLVYWNNLEYYGFGLGATGYLNSIRYTNTRSLQNYINGKYILDENEVALNEQIENEMILGLRKTNGINKEEFYNKYKKDVYEVFNIESLIKNKYLIDNGKYLYINKKYFYVQNSILLKFIGGLNE